MDAVPEARLAHLSCIGPTDACGCHGDRGAPWLRIDDPLVAIVGGNRNHDISIFFPHRHVPVCGAIRLSVVSPACLAKVWPNETMGHESCARLAIFSCWAELALTPPHSEMARMALGGGVNVEPDIALRTGCHPKQQSAYFASTFTASSKSKGTV